MKVAVIGAGASGMMAAYAAAMNGNEVTVYEKNEKCGKKIYITGKGRCNITNDVPPQEFLQNVVTNPKFLTGAIYSFSSDDTVAFFENNGLRVKTERGNRVFPLSDKSSDVIKCLETACRNAGVKFNFNSKIDNISIISSTVSDIIVNNNRILCDKVIVCTGGVSYPSTGSTGDGLNFAKAAGHNIIPVKPALCGLNLKGNYFGALQGLSLKNVGLNIIYNGKVLRSLFGEMLFTHFGVSGPVILSASSHMQNPEKHKYKLFIDLKPALDFDTLDKRVQRDFHENHNRDYINSLSKLLPNKLIPIIVSLSKIPPSLKVNQITKEQRTALVHLIKNFEVDIVRFRPIDEAIITSGGVSVKEINPKTMQSKLIDNLYFAGEVIDVDAYTGGFNLQIAFSTGYLCGKNM